LATGKCAQKQGPDSRQLGICIAALLEGASGIQEAGFPEGESTAGFDFREIQLPPTVNVLGFVFVVFFGYAGCKVFFRDGTRAVPIAASKVSRFTVDRRNAGAASAFSIEHFATIRGQIAGEFEKCVRFISSLPLKKGRCSVFSHNGDCETAIDNPYTRDSEIKPPAQNRSE